jgi:hypothetical protein
MTRTIPRLFRRLPAGTFPFSVVTVAPHVDEDSQRAQLAPKQRRPDRLASPFDSLTEPLGRDGLPLWAEEFLDRLATLLRRN